MEKMVLYQFVGRMLDLWNTREEGLGGANKHSVHSFRKYGFQTLWHSLSLSVILAMAEI